MILTLVSMTVAAQAQNNYTISGDLSVMTSKIAIPVKADTVYILNDSTMITPAGQQQEKYAVRDGKFEISGSVSRPIYSNLMVQLEIDYQGQKRKTMQPVPFILEPGNIVLDSDWVLLKGTPLNDASIAMCEKLNKLAEANENEKLKQEATSFVKLHAADPASIFVIMQATNFMNAKDILKLLELCSEDMQHTNTNLALIRDRLFKEANSPQQGDKFTDFAVEYEGKTTRFSDYVGKGQYTLVDFWASWCGPCRAEMPTVVKAYTDYHDKGFEVVGVSLDNSKEAWVKAIDKLKMPWPQMSDLRGWECRGARLYNIQSIPANILIDQQGKIVAKNLRGEGLLSKMADLMK